MKTQKNYLISLVMFCCLLAGTLTVKAADPVENKDLEKKYDLESIYKLDILSEEIENLLSEKDQVQIYDSNDQLIAEGTRNQEKIKGYLGISDLLIEIDGVQYYRLSYK